ncbi:uncharacterized protein LOC126667302 [Mercurialis annua]|uniref:uncharacterized protein LOC126667302 n=1 Tax=Mercurialis annua TaxID=3986 RepID=UPI00215F8CBA|nr:uncharacterized protein LOC126667302 [Mercurialis annua]
MKLMNLSSWIAPASGKQATGTKKLHVKVKPLKLEGLVIKNNGQDLEKEKLVVVEMKWKGPNSHNKLFLPLIHRGFLNKYLQRNFTSHKFLNKEDNLVEWDEEFENICNFLVDSKNCYCSWRVSFKIFYGEDAKSRTKLTKIGKVSLNIAELLASSSKIDALVEKKLPVLLQMNGVKTQATLSIFMSFAEVRNCIVASEIVQNSAELCHNQPITKIPKTQRSPTLPSQKNKLYNSVSSCTSKNPTRYNSAHWPGKMYLSKSKNESSDRQCNSELIVKLQSKKRWSFALSKRKRESSIDQKVNFDQKNAEEMQFPDSQNCSSWREKELVSRDGQTKLKANVFFASFDQRSEKAAGESACAALVAVIAHWLQSNQDAMPTTSQFDSLIAEGSSEWRKLCNNDFYTNSFPDNHFDLETVLRAELRPVNILHNKSYTGIFNPEKFENLKGAKSFDEIWEEIDSITEDYDQRIYIVSWNDHFFVLKADSKAYYIIDSLGERLFEGCSQAYILKFDHSSLMYGKAAKDQELESQEITANASEDEDGSEKIICKGKECCREFITRFLAAIPIRELEEQEKKGSVPTFSLLQRLQIDFHYCSSTSSSSAASPISSLCSSDE